jgi:hypothetical protein
MKRVAVILLLVAGGCARRMPPRATALDAQRANMTLAELEQGRSLVVSKCGSRCHKPPMPNDHTPSEWPKAMDEMAPRASVTFDERRAIERYLVAMTTKS